MPRKTKTAAIITIHRPADMTLAGRKRIAAWLNRQARFLRKYGPKMARTFRARYLY